MLGSTVPPRTLLQSQEHTILAHLRHVVLLDLHLRAQFASVFIMNSRKPSSRGANNCPQPPCFSHPPRHPPMKGSCHPEIRVSHSLLFKIWFYWGAWAAQSVKHPSLGLSSGHDLTVRRLEPHVGSALTIPSPRLGFSLSASLSAPLLLMLSLFLKINK